MTRMSYVGAILYSRPPHGSQQIYEEKIQELTKLTITPISHFWPHRRLTH